MDTKNNRKETIFVGVSFVFGTFCLALCYNLFFQPNNLVVGGMSGIALILNRYTGMQPQIFIYASSLILLVVSYIFLGKEETKRTLIGSLLYPLFITFSAPIANIMLRYFSFDQILVTVIISGLMYGTASGVVYKYGYTTGGADVILQLLCKYFHLNQGKASMIVNGIIILLGSIAYGFTSGVYAIIILSISSAMVDKIVIGMSDSKKFMIYTKNEKKVMDVISNEFKTGFTIFPTVGGYSHTKGSMIMCVIRNRDVNLFKDRILEIDKAAFFVVSDCYQVQGGVKRSNLPFI